MKKKIMMLLCAALSIVLAIGCGDASGEETVSVVGNGEEVSQAAPEGGPEVIDLDIAGGETAAVSENVAEPEDENHDGMYRSELTNEWIDEAYRDQRPVAVMVDNEKTALPHFGVNSADIVYEIMNSTENDRVTRLMVIKKDWQNITQFGSVRSVRPTNFMLAVEYNAIILHDGGPFYIDEYVARPYTNNLSGGFARFSNGKATEFTEYITYDDYTNPTTGKSYDGLRDRLAASGYSTTYNEWYPGPHFNFSNEEFTLDGYDNVKDVIEVDFPFPHNHSKLFYNTETCTYDYYEYGMYHVDPLDNDNVTSFKNVIIYSCPFTQLDANGYLVYNIVNSGEGWYLTNGKAVPISWSKADEQYLTEFTNKATGEPILMNTGTTYIAVVPSDVWGEMIMK